MNQQSILSAWLRKLNFSSEEYCEWKLSRVDNLENNRINKLLYEKTQLFSKTYQKSFLESSVLTSHLLNKNLPNTEETIEEYLKRESKVSPDFTPSFLDINKNFKTIMLTGRTGEGKTTMVKQLLKEESDAASCVSLATPHLTFYTLKDCGLNIIDTQGLDKDNEDNQVSLNLIMEDFRMQFKDTPFLDAIIVMWCPRKNCRSGIMKTIENLRVTCGENVIKSCIVMIQGNWRSLVDEIDFSAAVNQTVEEVRKTFPEMPIIEYDAKGPLGSQIHLLKGALEKVQPYKFADFEEQQKKGFFDMLGVLAFKEGKIQQNVLKVKGKMLRELSAQRVSLSPQKEPKEEKKNGKNNYWWIMILALSFMFLTKYRDAIYQKFIRYLHAN